MRFAIDIREACRPQRAGKGQWTYGFLSELLRREIPLIAYSDAPLPPSLSGRGIDVRQFSNRGLSWHFQVASDVRRRDADLYISPTSFIVPCLLGRKFPVIPMVHDLIAFRREPHNRRATFIECRTLPRALRSAAHILTTSESTKRDLLDRYRFLHEEFISPIFAGPMNEERPISIPDHRTILCIATLCPRKNQLRLIEAYSRLPSPLRAQYELLLVGARGWMDDDILALAARTPGVSWKGYVDDDEYDRLLSTCTLFALPSLYEGFGMQLLDALQRGVTVLTSDRGSIREVCGNAAHYVDPMDSSSIAEGLELLLRSDNMRLDLCERARQQAKRFTWVRTADHFLEAVRGVA